MSEFPEVNIGDEVYWVPDPTLREKFYALATGVGVNTVDLLICHPAGPIVRQAVPYAGDKEVADNSMRWSSTGLFTEFPATLKRRALEGYLKKLEEKLSVLESLVEGVIERTANPKAVKKGQ